MNAAFEKRLRVVWLILSVITAVQYLGFQAGGIRTFNPHALLTVSVISVSLIKVRLILKEFMELRHAPAPLRILADAWLLITATALLGTYLGVPLLRS
jgi:hypothetical protein